MKLCECGCQTQVKQRFVSGHNRRGVKASKETCLKSSCSHKGQHCSPKTEFTSDRVKEFHKDENFLKAQREGIKKTRGENHWNWHDGKSFETYPRGWSRTYKERIRCRDNHKCQNPYCKILHYDRKLDVHHIDYNKKNLLHMNLISLCRKCHVATNIDREFWIEFYNDIMNRKEEEYFQMEQSV